MDMYSLLREFADSWVLLAMFGFFVGVIVWVFRPGSTDIYQATSQIPLREDQAPISARQAAFAASAQAEKVAADV